LARLDHWRIFLHPVQDYLGRCFIALIRHEEDFLALSQAERDGLWEAARRLRAAQDALFQPDHYNCQALGNSLRHVHMHVTPRYQDPREFAGVTIEDEHWGTWPFPATPSRSGEWLFALRDALRNELASEGVQR
jgi:diadenosine tetraphosphate (Ap4A) HIT family hydrolase